MMKRLLALLLILATVTATIQIVTPKHIALESLDEMEISPVGPGHDVFLKFQRKTGGYVWDHVKLINEVDPDWELSSYNDYEYIYYIARVPPGKASGKYTFQFEISDNEGLKDKEIAIVQVFVTHDQDELIKVFPMPEKQSGYAAEVFTVPFKVHNKALSQVNYKISTSIKELPGIGTTTITESFLNDQTKTIEVPVLVPEEGEYTIVSKVWSDANPTIKQLVTSRAIVKPTFRSKLRSIGRGFPLVPMTMAPFYALLGVFGW